VPVHTATTAAPRADAQALSEEVTAMSPLTNAEVAFVNDIDAAFVYPLNA
jgi:hypothetical protein